MITLPKGYHWDVCTVCKCLTSTPDNMGRSMRCGRC